MVVTVQPFTPGRLGARSRRVDGRAIHAGSAGRLEVGDHGGVVGGPQPVRHGPVPRSVADHPAAEHGRVADPDVVDALGQRADRVGQPGGLPAGEARVRRPGCQASTPRRGHADPVRGGVQVADQHDRAPSVVRVRGEHLVALRVADPGVVRLGVGVHQPQRGAADPDLHAAPAAHHGERRRRRSRWPRRAGSRTAPSARRRPRRRRAPASTLDPVTPIHSVGDTGIAPEKFSLPACAA